MITPVADLPEVRAMRSWLQLFTYCAYDPQSAAAFLGKMAQEDPPYTAPGSAMFMLGYLQGACQVRTRGFDMVMKGFLEGDFHTKFEGAPKDFIGKARKFFRGWGK